MDVVPIEVALEKIIDGGRAAWTGRGWSYSEGDNGVIVFQGISNRLNEQTSCYLVDRFFSGNATTAYIILQEDTASFDLANILSGVSVQPDAISGIPGGSLLRWNRKV